MVLALIMLNFNRDVCVWQDRLDQQLMNGGGMAAFSTKQRHATDFQPPYFPPPYCPLPPHAQQHQSPADFLTVPTSADPYAAYLGNHGSYMAAAHPYVTGQSLLNVTGSGGFPSQYDRRTVDSYRSMTSSHDVIMAPRGHLDSHDALTIHQLNPLVDDSQTVSRLIH